MSVAPYNIDGVINADCGAEWVHKKRRPPVNVTADADEIIASLDGDADRIVYWTHPDPTTTLTCINGDKITVLLVTVIKKLLSKCQEASPNIRVVMTAYSNQSVV
jgi:phosphoacetylglucosamine mutase